MSRASPAKCPILAKHRDHAVVEQVFADWTDGPLAHLPSGSFAANAAWLTCAAITCNLLRAAGCLASRFHARAWGATIRAGLIDVAARLARRGRGRLALHLPQYWHRESAWLALSRPPAGHPPGWPDQPGPGHRTRTGHAPPGTTPPLPPSKEPGQAAEPVSGEKNTPAETERSRSPEPSPGNARTCAAGVGVPCCCACSHLAYAARVWAASCAGGVGLHRPAGRHVRPPSTHRGKVIVGRMVLLSKHHDMIHHLSHSPTLASAWPTFHHHLTYLQAIWHCPVRAISVRRKVGLRS